MIDLLRYLIRPMFSIGAIGVEEEEMWVSDDEEEQKVIGEEDSSYVEVEEIFFSNKITTSFGMRRRK